MNLLHIGDFHFKRNQLSQNKIIESLLESLPQAIDFIFFSGDLVFNGSSEKAFLEADDLLFEPLLKHFNLDRSDLFICPGNHDIDREPIINSIINEFAERKVVSTKDFEFWYNKQKSDRNASLLSSKNYNKYVSTKFSHPSKDNIADLATVHTRTINDKQIGIVCINNSWFCSGQRPDKGELLFLPSIIEDAIIQIEKCDMKILMQHHPISYYKESILYDLQDIIYSNFNLLLVGHLHKEFIETQYQCNNGIYCNTTKASLCDDDGEIGYSILNIDNDDFTSLTIERYHYIKSDNNFCRLNSVVVEIPTGEIKHKQNRLRKKLISKVNVELTEANKLLLNYDESDEKAFLQSFTNPLLSKNSDEESYSMDGAYKINFEELKKPQGNFLIFGKDKCGKTTLLKKLFIDFLQDFPTYGKVPLYIDYLYYENHEDGFDIKKILRNYYEITKEEVEKLITEDKLVVLIDNLNTSTSLHASLIDFLSQHSNIKFIICSEYLTSRIYGEELDDLSYEKCFFKNLNRSVIRAYTKKVPIIREDDHEIILEKVTNFCKQLQMPLNFWSVSLILLIYKKGRSDYSKNLFAVLDSCVDEILQKKKFLFEKVNLKFEQYKSICAEIAIELFKNYSSEIYSCNFQDLIRIVDDYRNKNPRIVTESKKIIDFLLDCGILKAKLNNRYTFRLNGIFEYFLAYFIKENEEFKNEILDNEYQYLSFKNELEIYSGFNRTDAIFLKRIYEKTKYALMLFNDKYDSVYDNKLVEKIDEAFQFDKSVKKLLDAQPLTEEDRDEVLDTRETFDTDVHVKVYQDAKVLSVEIVEKYISILARVLKNLDSVTDSQLIYEIFDYLLNSYCQFGFYIIDEMQKSAEAENLKVREGYELSNDVIIGEEIMKLLSRVIPILVQASMYDGLGNANFIKIIENKISEFEKDSDKNQYKLFVLYFLLIDIDLKKHKNFIDRAIKIIKLSPLKVSILFKLTFYMAFKSYDDKELESFIKNKILEMQVNLNNKVDIGEIHKSLSKTTKRKLVNLKKR
jgi:predicted phosphodiesterase